MPKFQVKVEEIVTYEVTIEAENGEKAERAAEFHTLQDEGALRERKLHSESIRALWCRDITPVEDQIESWIEQLQARGYRIKPPYKKGADHLVADGHADASADQAGDGDIRKDEARQV